MKRRNSTKNKILKTITTIAVIGALVSACCLDSKSKLPMYTLGGCVVYLTLFALANTNTED